MESKALVSSESPTQTGPDADFENFFRAQYPVVVRLAYGVVGDNHTAQDVAQDVFIAVRRRFSVLNGPSHAEAWVRVAAVHAGLNTLRGQRRLDARHQRAAVTAAPAGPEELVMEDVSRQEVREALARISPRAATVLVLRHSGLSYAEVAGAMDVAVGQVGTMLRRAEAALRKEIEHATRS